MVTIMTLAMKDLKLLLRDRMAAFFVFGFPTLMGLFFGLMMGGVESKPRAKITLAVVDQDDSEYSRAFVESLAQNETLAIEEDEIDAAADSVRLGNRLGMLVLPPKFGKTAGILWEEPAEITLGIDPSRQAEAAMLEGFVMEGMGKLAAKRFQDRAGMRPYIRDAQRNIAASEDFSPLQRQALTAVFHSLDSLFDSLAELEDDSTADGNGEVSTPGGPTMEFAKIKKLDVTREIDPRSMQGQLRKLRSRWDISFPQAMMWGVLGCAAGFATSVAQERSRGTLMRLQAAPVKRIQLMIGKAAACFISILFVFCVMTALGTMLGMRPESFPKLAVVGVAVATSFVGIMMTMATLGKTEEAVSGTGWAINMVMAMIGGCMVPVMFMPAVIQRLSIISPISWAIRAVEGAIWRGFTWMELSPPLAVLVSVGVAGLIFGTLNLSRQLREE